MHTKTTRHIVLIAILALAAVLRPVPSPAAGSLTVDIFGPGQRQVNLVILPPRNLAGPGQPPLAAEFERLVRQNLNLLPFLHIVPVSQLLGGDPSRGVTGQEIDFRPMQLARVDLAMTAGWRGDRLEAYVFETFSGIQKLGRGYEKVDAEILPRVADRFCAGLMKALTGREGFFESTLAFVKSSGNGKEIFTVKPQGRDLVKITSLGGYNTSPSWSLDGARLAFTHIEQDGHRLGVWDRATGRIVLKRFPGNTVISPAFTLDGDVVLTLDKTGSPDIYILDKNLDPVKPLVHSWAIDVSPSFDRSGNLVAFTSGRLGNPHIFMLDRRNQQVRRVTYEGKYNTNPCLSPDGRYLVFSRQMPGGHRIFLTNLQNGQEQQLTFGPGDDEDPAFGPDGYFVAFSSSRTGQYRIYLTTRHGDTPKVVNTGEGACTAPAWDTANRAY